MSQTRENTTWQSKDGKWNRAFYEFWHVNEDDEDFDPEWDVEYGDNFNWVSLGHATEAQADAAWTGSNPGGGFIVPYSDKTAAQCDGLDAKAAAFLALKR
jgi:hypothetical protein